MEYVKRASSRITNRLSPLLSGWFGWIVFAIAAYVIGMYLTTGVVFVLARLGVFAGIDAITSGEALQRGLQSGGVLVEVAHRDKR